MVDGTAAMLTAARPSLGTPTPSHIPAVLSSSSVLSSPTKATVKQPPVPDVVMATDIDDLLAGLGEDDLNDFEMDDFGVGNEDENDHDHYDDEPEWFAPPPGPDAPMVGFLTGAGKAVKAPSADALARARKLIEEVEHADDVPSDSKKRRVDEPATPADDMAPSLPSPLHPTSVFAPAADTPADTIAKLFNDDLSSATPSTSRLVPGQSVGFASAGGKVLPPPSSASRARALALFADDDNAEAGPSKTTLLPAQRTPVSAGFQLGSGGSAPAISAASRAQALALFGEEAPSRALSLSTPSRPPSRAAPGLAAPTSGTPGFSTPSRMPLRNKTNMGPLIKPLSAVTPARKAIEIKATPSSTRRIGLGSTPVRGKVKKSFVTPFKVGAAATTTTPRRATSLRGAAMTPAPPPPPAIEPVFDMTQEVSGPAFCILNSTRQINCMTRAYEIWRMDLSNAAFYRFVGHSGEHLDTAAALTQLQRDRCDLATAKWVENHWAMILWKLAGEVAARPALFHEKWHWEEVMSQLKYRYEREFNLAQRPIVRRILEHDSSPSVPMVLCVSAVHRPEPVADKDGTLVPQRPFVDLIDGWYRIQAQLDDCLSRAVEKGKIVVGRKLAISGAQLVSADSAEALEAYGTSHLTLSGNSCHLARWDARLGRQAHPFIAGLASLSPDGGTAVLIDAVIENVFPLGFANSEKGNREAPWDLAEEGRRADEWQERYEAERSRLQEDCQKSVEPAQDLAQMLAACAEDAMSEGSGGEMYHVPDNVDDEYESLLGAANASVRLRTMPRGMVVALATHAAERVAEESAVAREQMEKDLQQVCPPRQIRDFRMIRVRDAWAGRKSDPPARTAKINVWDARALGELKTGQRYLISNLVPGRQGDWRVTKEPTEIFLHTRRDTRWQVVEAAANVA